ncbi:Syntaxin-5 [Mactra antiquata]
MITRRRKNNSESDDPPNPYNSRYQQNSQTFVSQVTSAPSDSDLSSTYFEPEMSCRDRTNEFRSAVKSLQSRQVNGVTHSRRSEAIGQRSEFTKIAKRIGKDLANTFAKLEKLALLAKRKSLFDDKPVEIQELTYIIKEDINSLNSQIAQLQQVARSQGQNGRQKQSHSNTVVLALQSRLASMSTDFKQVLEVRTENMKQQKSRREQFSQSSVMTPPSQGFGNPGQSVLLQDEAKHNGSAGGDFAIDMDMDKSRYQQQLQLIDQQDAYINDRANTMQNIESTIVELGQIFTQLAHMVKEQEESVQRIDSNVEEAHLNVEAAHGELLKYFQSVTNNRWLMIKIFAVLIIFFIIFIVFMA